MSDAFQTEMSGTRGYFVEAWEEKAQSEISAGFADSVAFTYTYLPLGTLHYLEDMLDSAAADEAMTESNQRFIYEEVRQELDL